MNIFNRSNKINNDYIKNCIDENNKKIEKLIKENKLKNEKYELINNVIDFCEKENFIIENQSKKDRYHEVYVYLPNEYYKFFADRNYMMKIDVEDLDILIISKIALSFDPVIYNKKPSPYLDTNSTSKFVFSEYIEDDFKRIKKILISLKKITCSQIELKKSLDIEDV